MVFSQERRSGGMLLELDGKRIAIDPGPGSLVNMQQLKLQPEKIDAVMVSHTHVDHCSDANILLDGIEKPVVVAEEHCVRKKADYDEWPKISRHHQKKSEVFALNADQSAQIGSLGITATKANHSCPCIGFVITGSRKIGYASDGIYYKGQEKYFDGCDLLVLNIHLPKGSEIVGKYMSVDDAILLLKAMKKKPALTVISHISTLMVRANLWRQVKIIQESTGASVIFAEDFMEIDLDNVQAKHEIVKKL